MATKSLGVPAQPQDQLHGGRGDAGSQQLTQQGGGTDEKDT